MADLRALVLHHNEQVIVRLCVSKAAFRFYLPFGFSRWHEPYDFSHLFALVKSFASVFTNVADRERMTISSSRKPRSSSFAGSTPPVTI